ncbi:MAG: energy-coupling factor transporter transmembrane component T [Anaerolineales bacterium]
MSTPTLYIPRSSGLHALHPLTKIAMTGVFFVAAATLSNVWWLLALYAVGLLPLAFWGQVFRPFIKSNALLIWPFALSLFLIQGFFARGTHVLLQLGPLSLKEEGLWLAAHFTARLLVWLGAAVLMMIVTRPDKLMLALIERGMPRQIAYIILAALQIIPRFQDKAQGILDAQRSRGLETEGSLIHRMRNHLTTEVPLQRWLKRALRPRKPDTTYVHGRHRAPSAARDQGRVSPNWRIQKVNPFCAGVSSSSCWR